MNEAALARPSLVARFRSRQSGLPSGLVGRIFGRAMEGATQAANDVAVEALDLREPRTILEIGFGQGRTVARLAADGHTVYGVDPSATMVRQAAARNRAACRAGRVTLHIGDGITMPFPDASVDSAITVHTLYFMADPATTIADIARVLRPAGTFVVACRTSDTKPPVWMDPDVYRFRSAADITTLLHNAGFDVEHRPGSADSDQTHLFIARHSSATRS